MKVKKNFNDTIKDTLRGYRTMTSTIRRKLKKIGFSIDEGGRHYKLRYDNKIFILSKTASDRRTGIIFAHQILAAI